MKSNEKKEISPSKDEFKIKKISPDEIKNALLNTFSPEAIYIVMDGIRQKIYNFPTLKEKVDYLNTEATKIANNIKSRPDLLLIIIQQKIYILKELFFGNQDFELLSYILELYEGLIKEGYDNTKLDLVNFLNSLYEYILKNRTNDNFSLLI
jgi:hypothetical protein